MAILTPIVMGLMLFAILMALFFIFRGRRGSRWLALAALVILALTALPLLTTLARTSFAPAQAAAPEVADVASQPPAALNTAQDYLAQGDYQFDLKDYAAALAAYTQAIALKPDYAEAYNNRAYTYMTQQDYAPALADLNRALELRPDYVNALMNRGDIHNYYYDINYDAALADYNRIEALGADYTSVCGHRMLALHHGWNVATVIDLLSGGGHACAH